VKTETDRLAWKATYRQKLLDPRWQRKRLEILNRDNWACRFCESNSKTLHVHHEQYEWGRDPWDYPNDLLTTLCVDCHEATTQVEADLRESEKQFTAIFRKCDFYLRLMAPHLVTAESLSEFLQALMDAKK
jgi:hypothetical protein